MSQNAADKAPQTTPEATTEPTKEEIATAEAKDLMQRYGLKKAWVEKDNCALHFDEEYVKRQKGKSFTEITA